MFNTHCKKVKNELKYFTINHALQVVFKPAKKVYIVEFLI